MLLLRPGFWDKHIRIMEFEDENILDFWDFNIITAGFGDLTY